MTDRPSGDAVVERFIVGRAATGDLQVLMDVLAPDVVLLTDGGGRKQAALQPIRGAEKVLRFLAGIREKIGDAGAVPMDVNGGARPRSAPRRRARRRS